MWSDVVTVNKTERPAARQIQCPRQVPEEYQEPVIYTEIRDIAPGAPSQSTTNTDQYLEIMETPSQTDQESTSEYDHYDRPDNPYEGLDPRNRELPPPPSVYARIAQ